MPIHRDVDSIVGDGVYHAPSIHIDSEAAKRLIEATAVVTEICDVTGDEWEREITWKDVEESRDPTERHHYLLNLVNSCKGVTTAQVNGLFVVAPAKRSARSIGGRKRFLQAMKREGIAPEQCKPIYSAFGDQALEMTDDIAAAMLRSYVGNGRNFSFTEGTDTKGTDAFKTQNVRLGAKRTQERVQYGNGSKRNYIPLMRANVDSLEVEEALRQYGIETADVNIERVCFEMADNGLGIDELGGALKKRSEIGYIAKEYGTSYEVASAVHEELAAETKGMLDLDVLSKMDLSFRVEAFRHGIEKSTAKVSSKGYIGNMEAVVVCVSDLPEHQELMEAFGITLECDDPDSPEYGPGVPEFDAIAPSGRLYRFRQSTG